MKRKISTKTCPRCKEKNDFCAYKCCECGLVFSRLEHTSNKLAKINIRKGEKIAVVYVTEFPSDLVRWKVLLYTIFLGLFGVHAFYVGRYVKSLFMFLGGILLVVCVSLPSLSQTADVIRSTCAIPIGILGIAWLFDIVNVCMYKFKVPVSIDVLGDAKWKR